MNTDTDSITKLLQSLKESYSLDSSQNLMLAGIYKTLGDSDKALSLLFTHKKSNPDNLSIKPMIAEIYYERWMIDEAKKYLEELIDAFPNNEKALHLVKKYPNDPHLKTKLSLSIASKQISRKNNDVSEELE